MIYSVSYDLREHGRQDYKHLIAALEKFTVRCPVLQSVWLIETNMTPEQVHTYLKPHLGATDSLLIVPVVFSGWWSQGLPEPVLTWLHAAHKAETQRRAG